MKRQGIDRSAELAETTALKEKAASDACGMDTAPEVR
jgi:hypothetical protein